MITMRALGLAVGVAFAASSFAFAQDSNPAASNPAANNPPANNPAANNPAANNPPANAAASGGSGTHQTAQKTGSAANTKKVLGNRQGYRHVAGRQGRQMHARPGQRHLVAFVPSWRCRMLLREGRPLAKSCRRR
jgi:hypothetical protein